MKYTYQESLSPTSHKCVIIVNCYYFVCREAVAHESILNMPERIDWRECSNSKQDEMKMAADFRAKFEKYDFNM